MNSKASTRKLRDFFSRDAREEDSGLRCHAIKPGVIITMNHRIVVFEKVTRSDMLAVLWYVLRGYDIYYLDADRGAVGRWWFVRLSASKRLSELTLSEPPFNNFHSANHQAFEVVEEIYDDHYQNDPLVRRLVKLFASTEIHLAFKKALTMELWQFNYQHLLGVRVRQAFPSANRLVFISHDAQFSTLPPSYHKYLSRLEGWSDDRPVILSPWQRVRRLNAAIRGSVRVTLVGIRAMGLAALNFLKPHGIGPAPGRYSYAMTIVNPRHDFANDVRGADFLLDGVDIRNDNTLFVPFSKLSPQQVQQAAEKGLNVIDVDMMPSWQTWLKWAVVQVSLLTRYALSPSWMRGASTSMTKAHLAWNAFVEKYEVDHFVTHADFMLWQVARNIILRRSGATTWYYLDSLNTEYHMLKEGKANVRQWAWAFLVYDYCVTWNDLHVDSFKAHKQQIGHYRSVGCLWSEHIQGLRGGNTPLRFQEQLTASGYKPGQRMVALFDTTYMNGTRDGYPDGILLLEDIQRLLEAYPDIFVVLKEKKPREQLGQHGYSVQQNIYGMIEKLEQLEKHPRCYLPGFAASAAEIIAASELTISYSFTSTTLEALGARIKALFYTPYDHNTYSFYDQIPNLVIHGYDELETRVGELLYRTSAEEYGQYLDENIKGMVDPYLDGLAITRFRQLLSNSETPVSGEPELIPVGRDLG